MLQRAPWAISKCHWRALGLMPARIHRPGLPTTHSLVPCNLWILRLKGIYYWMCSKICLTCWNGGKDKEQDVRKIRGIIQENQVLKKQEQKGGEVKYWGGVDEIKARNNQDSSSFWTFVAWTRPQAKNEHFVGSRKFFIHMCWGNVASPSSSSLPNNISSIQERDKAKH